MFQILHCSLEAAVTRMDAGQEDRWLYATEDRGIYVLSDAVLGPKEREYLNVEFIISTGQIREGHTLEDKEIVYPVRHGRKILDAKPFADDSDVVTARVAVRGGGPFPRFNVVRAFVRVPDKFVYTNKTGETYVDVNMTRDDLITLLTVYDIGLDPKEG